MTMEIFQGVLPRVYLLCMIQEGSVIDEIIACRRSEDNCNCDHDLRRSLGKMTQVGPAEVTGRKRTINVKIRNKICDKISEV